jgi:hypothetical protein
MGVCAGVCCEVVLWASRLWQFNLKPAAGFKHVERKQGMRDEDSPRMIFVDQIAMACSAYHQNWQGRPGLDEYMLAQGCFTRIGYA